MSDIYSGLAYVGRVESNVKLIVYGFFASILIGLGIAIILFNINTQYKGIGELMLIVGMIILFGVTVNYYLTNRFKTLAAIEGGDLIFTSL